MIEFREGKIILGKEPNELDKFVLRFVQILEEVGIMYVIVSGYPAILFGRTRTTEDVDIIIERISRDKTNLLVDKLENLGFWLINAGDDSYNFLAESNLRIGESGRAIPNIELKMEKSETDRHSLENSVDVILGGASMKVSPLELEIAYKLFLGSKKDIEDARHIYKLFREYINNQELERWIRILKVEKLRRKLD